MTTNLRGMLADSLSREFIIQAVNSITASENVTAVDDIVTKKKPGPAPGSPAPVPDTTPVKYDSEEGKQFDQYTNYLNDVGEKIKHSVGMLNSYSQSFQKELKNTVKLFEARKGNLNRGLIRRLAELVSDVEKALRGIDSVADRFEFLNESARNKGGQAKPEKSTNVTEKNREKLGLKPITDVDKDLKEGETKTKFKDFFKDIKTKFGSKPQAASFLMAKVLIDTAKTLSE